MGSQYLYQSLYQRVHLKSGFGFLAQKFGEEILFVKRPEFERFCYLALVQRGAQSPGSAGCEMLVCSPRQYCSVWVLGSKFASP